MIDYYNKYYLSSEKIGEMLSNPQTPIVFDTSALLALYFYSENTRDEIFTKIFDYCHDRLWIPAQAFFEFQKNRNKTSKKPIAAYKALIDSNVKDGAHIYKILKECESINKSIKAMEGQIKTVKEQTQKNDKHPYIESSTYDVLCNLINTYKNYTNTFGADLQKFSESYEEKIHGIIQSLNDAEDQVYDTIITKFKIGSEFSYNEMIEIAHEGATRYSEQIPPGYKDNEKIGLQKYGDLFFWKQLLRYARSKSKKDILLITNDAKEDWIEQEDKKTPRFELLKEFNSETGKSIWIMSLKEFIFSINNAMTTQLGSDAITEVENMEPQPHHNTLDLDELESTVQTLLSPLDIWIDSPIPINDDLRLFDKPVLYKAESSDQVEYRITITIIGGKSYARTLHALSNPFEIKKYYQRNNERYRYINVVILRNKGLTNEVLTHLEKKTSKKNFNDKSIRTIICYYNESKMLEEIITN